LRITYSIEKEAYKSNWGNVEEKGTILADSENGDQVPHGGS
jgi:hypothetical protein